MENWNIDLFVDKVNEQLSHQNVTSEDKRHSNTLNPRLIRDWQQKELISPPRREGREAFFGPQHVQECLKVKSLMNQGYSTHLIAQKIKAERSTLPPSSFAFHAPPPSFSEQPPFYAASCASASSIGANGSFETSHSRALNACSQEPPNAWNLGGATKTQSYQEVHLSCGVRVSFLENSTFSSREIEVLKAELMHQLNQRQSSF